MPVGATVEKLEVSYGNEIWQKRENKNQTGRRKCKTNETCKTELVRNRKAKIKPADENVRPSL